MAKKRLVGDAESLKILEALRLGVVPADCVTQFTVGREQEFAIVKEDIELAKSQGAARVFLGDYGCGKTHMLEYIEETALAEGFLTSRVVLDSARIPPSQPKRVYSELIRRLRYPHLGGGDLDDDGQGQIESLLRSAQKKSRPAFFNNSSEEYHAYFSPIIQSLSCLEDESLRSTCLEWISGHNDLPAIELQQALRQATRQPVRLYALKDFRPWAHLYSYLVGGLAHLAQQAGYKGLVVLFDEAEFYALLRGAARDFADLLFGYYAAAALGPERSHFDANKAKKGGHAIHRSFKPGYRSPIPLYCVFAMTEDPYGVVALRRVLGDGLMHRLQPLNLGHYQELASRVVEIYKLAYPDFQAADRLHQPMGQVLFRGVENGRLENPRQVLKFILEILDVARLSKDSIQPYVEEVVALVCR